jgi:hypothetical protein
MWNMEIKPMKPSSSPYHGGHLGPGELHARAENKVSDRDSRCCHRHGWLQREIEPARDVDEHHLATTWH